MATKHYNVTGNELLAIIAALDSYSALASNGEDTQIEANKAQRAVKAISKRNNIKFERDYASTKDTSIDNIND